MSSKYSSSPCPARWAFVHRHRKTIFWAVYQTHGQKTYWKRQPIETGVSGRYGKGDNLWEMSSKYSSSPCPARWAFVHSASPMPLIFARPSFRMPVFLKSMEGAILNYCDYSYTSQKDHILGRISDTWAKDILEKSFRMPVFLKSINLSVSRTGRDNSRMMFSAGISS